MKTPLRTLLISGLLAVSLMANAAPVKVETSGYVQGRYESAPGSTGKQLNLNRALVASKVFATDKTGVFLVACNQYNTNTPELQYAYAFMIDGNLEYRAGLSTIPFGYENPISASRLITLERSKICSVLLKNTILGGNAGLDRGIFVNYTPKDGIGLQGAILNGTPYTKSSDANANKNVLVRVFKPIAGGELGASLYVGKSDANALMNRAGIDFSKVIGNYTIISEVMGGKGSIDSGSNESAYGGYVTVSRRAKDSDIAPYARLEAADQNANANGSIYKAATLGVAYFVAPTAKVSGQILVEKSTEKTTCNKFGLQYQVTFK